MHNVKDNAVILNQANKFMYLFIWIDYSSSLRSPVAMLKIVTPFKNMIEFIAHSTYQKGALRHMDASCAIYH